MKVELCPKFQENISRMYRGANIGDIQHSSLKRWMFKGDGIFNYSNSSILCGITELSRPGFSKTLLV